MGPVQNRLRIWGIAVSSASPFVSEDIFTQWQRYSLKAAGIVSGFVHGLVRLLAHFFRKCGHVAHYAYADVVFIQVVQFAYKVFQKKIEQRPYLFLGPLPVFGGKGIYRQITHTDPFTVAGNIHTKGHGEGRKSK